MRENENFDEFAGSGFWLSKLPHTRWYIELPCTIRRTLKCLKKHRVWRSIIWVFCISKVKVHPYTSSSRQNEVKKKELIALKFIFQKTLNTVLTRDWPRGSWLPLVLLSQPVAILCVSWLWFMTASCLKINATTMSKVCPE